MDVLCAVSACGKATIGAILVVRNYPENGRFTLRKLGDRANNRLLEVSVRISFATRFLRHTNRVHCLRQLGLV